MYYHSQDIKHVFYDKIYPAPVEVIDQDFIKPYKWLGKYCGYCPQIWLSRSKLSITGYKAKNKKKSSKFFGQRRNFEPNVMFGFDVIKGFPLDYQIWCFCLGTLMGCKDPVKDGDEAIINSFKELKQYYKMDEIRDLDNSDPLWHWLNSKDYDDFLKNHMFVENDQVVVPSLNLKVAKQIFCRNEKQVKALRHMGFIQDRIKILTTKQWS